MYLCLQSQLANKQKAKCVNLQKVATSIVKQIKYLKTKKLDREK